VIAWRLPFAAAAALACVGAGLFAFLPRATPLQQAPAADAHGIGGWAWPGGVPGYAAGTSFTRLNMAQVEPLELQAAQLAAIRHRLDPHSVRIVEALRPNANGLLAVLAATTYDTQPSPETSCLAAVLPGDRPVVWRCPGSGGPSDLAPSAVLVAAGEYRWPSAKGVEYPLYLAGVARGDVRRVVLEGRGFRKHVLYTRGESWGQFEGAFGLPRRPWRGRLLVYGRAGLLQVVPLRLTVGRETVLP
jgi:hypothetical protein